MTENENIQTPDLTPMAHDLIQNEAPDNALVALLNELEETASELRTELEARHGLRQQAAEESAAPRQPKKNPNVTPEQEAELNEHFEEYWTNAQGSWKNLFRLLREFRTEMKEGKQHG